jgi:hypothetical protein
MLARSWAKKRIGDQWVLATRCPVKPNKFIGSISCAHCENYSGYGDGDIIFCNSSTEDVDKALRPEVTQDVWPFSTRVIVIDDDVRFDATDPDDTDEQTIVFFDIAETLKEKILAMQSDVVRGGYECICLIDRTVDWTQVKLFGECMPEESASRLYVSSKQFWFEAYWDDHDIELETEAISITKLTK